MTPGTRSLRIRSTPAFRRDRRGRAAHAGPRQFHGDHAGVLVHLSQEDVAVVGLHRWADGLNHLGYGVLHSLIVSAKTRFANLPADLVQSTRQPSDRLGTVEVLAHQGGWDEILLVAAPLALLAGLLYLANRRASQRQTSAPSALSLPTKFS